MIGSKERWRSWRRSRAAEAEAARTELGYPGAEGRQPHTRALSRPGETLWPGEGCATQGPPLRERGPHPYSEPALAGQHHIWPCPGLGIVLSLREAALCLTGHGPFSAWAEAGSTVQGCSALCLDEHRFASSSGCQAKQFLEHYCCFSVGPCAEGISSGMGNRHCWPPTPSPLSPLLQGYSSHPGRKGVQQQHLTLLFVLLLFRERLDVGMHGTRAPEEQEFVPNPLGNARGVALVHMCHVEATGAEIPPVPCSVRE